MFLELGKVSFTSIYIADSHEYIIETNGLWQHKNYCENSLSFHAQTSAGFDRKLCSLTFSHKPINIFAERYEEIKVNENRKHVKNYFIQKGKEAANDHYSD